jgi:hypothetical protein
MRKTLAEQLLMATGRPIREVPANGMPDNSDIRALVQKFEGRNGRSITQSGEMPNDVAPGDRYLIKLTEKDGIKATSITRPTIIWGVYRNKHGKVMAVATIGMTSQNKGKNFDERRLYSDNLLIDTEYEMRLSASKKQGVIILNTVRVLPWLSIGQKGHFLDHAGLLGKVSPLIFPHLVVRRADAIVNNIKAEFSVGISFDPKWVYEGLYLPNLPVQKSNDPAPEIDCKCERLEKPFGGLNQDTIAQLVRYQMNMFHRDHYAENEKRKFTRYPAARHAYQTWPNWKEWSTQEPPPIPRVCEPESSPRPTP